ncbi:hypothetical protein [Burkholderia cepacia]|uniref:hypothetical protein n=1 Tax=Burkholderia cepacia TaxID=292 RepID=UPI00075DA7FB|nr:hypothetical protein [Burkholderia cepacia]KVX53309.1 hypothetical protein WL06_16155 [Burkholderia cepacia]
MNPWMKFIAAVLLFGAWLALVLLHFVPAQSLVDAIGYTLAGLGVYHATASSVGPVAAGLVGTAELSAVEPLRDVQRPVSNTVSVGGAAVPVAPASQAATAPTIQ